MSFLTKIIRKPPEQHAPLETTTTINMTSTARPASIASSTVSAATNQQNPSNSAKKQQQIKPNKNAASASGRPNSEMSSTTDMTELGDRVASVSIKSNPNAPNSAPTAKPQLSRAERRTIQENQRAAKQQGKSGTPTLKPTENQHSSVAPKKSAPEHTATLLVSAASSASIRPVSEAGESVLSVISRTAKTSATVPTPYPQSKQQSKKPTDERVTLFSHLTIYTRDLELLAINSKSNLVHPAIIKLGLQYASRQIVGSNLRCVTFLVALQKMIDDYEGPSNPNESCARDLDAKLKTNISFLTKCRPNAVSMGAAIRYVKTFITNLPPRTSPDKAKELLTDVISRFVREKIDLPGQAIAETIAISKITNGDVILIFGYSTLIMRILDEAVKQDIQFRVIIADSRPQEQGLKAARRLLALNVHCTYVLISAVPFIISEVSKVLLGAHALLGNGYVMSQVGTAQISLIAKTHNVPVLVCCETYKFCERVQTDSFVVNELGDPNDLIAGHPLLRAAMSSALPSTPSSTTGAPPSNPNLNVLNMTYDVTPPTFISAVITELGILPCTSVAVVIRMQNKELEELCGQEQELTSVSTNPALNSPSDSVQ